MKLLTLSQPWASLVAIGAKRIETRPWQTSYRGPIAIHAGKGLNGIFKGATHDDLLDVCEREPFASVLLDHGLGANELPRGVVIAVADLDLVTSTEYADETLADPDLAAPHERAFGDYSPGRYLWLLANVRPLAEPVELRGERGLVPIEPSVVRQIRRQMEVTV